MRYVLVVVLLLIGCGRVLVGPMGAPGKNGLSSLIQLVPNDPACPSGGTLELSGLDVNSDGLLEASEVQYSADICNGSNGQNAPSNPNTPVTTIAPCGKNSSPYKEILLCLAGGGILSSFSDSLSGSDTRFAFLPTGSYEDTDQSGCLFGVLVNSDGSSTVSWNAGSNQYASWQSQIVTCEVQ